MNYTKNNSLKITKEQCVKMVVSQFPKKKKVVSFSNILTTFKLAGYFVNDSIRISLTRKIGDYGDIQMSRRTFYFFLPQCSCDRQTSHLISAVCGQTPRRKHGYICSSRRCRRKMQLLCSPSSTFFLIGARIRSQGLRRYERCVT